MKSRKWMWTSVVNFLTALAFAPAIPSAQAQTYNVIHSFTGAVDGSTPSAGLTTDGAGNFYGTAQSGGLGVGTCGSGCGTVFKLRKVSSAWVITPLYSFLGNDDGFFPIAAVSLGPNGTLYGTTPDGGVGGAGTVFNLYPPVTICRTALCSWNETLLYQFSSETGGGFPDSTLVFDRSGNIFSTAPFNGSGCNCGVVYELTPSGSGWSENTVYSFSGGNDGAHPEGVVFDQANNLYGITQVGGSNDVGTIYQLSHSGTGWQENVIHSFQPNTDGAIPIGALIIDRLGNLYGTTIFGGPGNEGTVFMLSPAGGNWTFTVLYSWSRDAEPQGSLAIDAAGNLYGTTEFGGTGCEGRGCGTVFKLEPTAGGWVYSTLHEFLGHPIDGGFPFGNLLVDAGGNLYGTASSGGVYGRGIAWEITP